VLENVLERVIKGKIKRVLVFEAPRHGKSEILSRLFTGYYLTRFPERHVGLTSYSAELAYNLSKDARGNFEQAGGKLRTDSQAVSEWRTDQNGMLWADGVGGSITGKGFWLGLIDDPFKGRAEAYSETIRNSVWDWYRSVFYTRQEPDAIIVLIMTRWHDDDLAGRILRMEKEEPEHWHIVNFSADEVTKPERFPSTCTVEPDWRENDGIALCPERYPIQVLDHYREILGESTYNALYRQRPAADEGVYWKSKWFKTYQGAPECETYGDGIDWDTAETEKDENCACAYVRSCVGTDGNIYVADLGFDWLEFPAMIKWMKSFDVFHYIEAKSSGKSAAQMLNKAGIYANEVKVTGGDKIARTILATPIVETGKVFIRKDLLDKLLNDDRQGILRFPAGQYDDLNDAFVQMLHRQRAFQPIVQMVKKSYETMQEYMEAEVFEKIIAKFEKGKKPSWKTM
jgi:phage terminase large subunit-like protein